MAKKDWKRAAHDAIDAIGERLRDVLESIDGMLSPQPDMVPVPVPADGRRRRPTRR